MIMADNQIMNFATIPTGTTLNISSPLGMTGLDGVTIVCSFPNSGWMNNTVVQDLQGTVKFNDDVEYWSEVRL